MELPQAPMENNTSGNYIFLAVQFSAVYLNNITPDNTLIRDYYSKFQISLL